MIRRTSLTLAVIFTITVSAFSFQQNGYTLNTGDIYVVDSETSQEILQMIMGQENVITTKTTAKEMLEIEGKTGDLYSIKVTTLSLRVEANAMGMEQVFDSDDPSAAGGFFAALKNSTYYFTMDDKGKIEDIHGLDALRDSLTNASTSNPQIAMQVNQYLSEETIRTNLQNRFSIYSEDGSDSWTTEAAFTVNDMPVHYATEYSLVEPTMIKAESTITMEGSAVTMGMPVELDMEGTQEVYHRLDSATGFPRTSETTSNVAGTVEAQGMKIPMTIDTKATTSLTKQ
jgi:hypothetical protein